MGKAEFRTLFCRTAVNRVEGMPFRWSLNPYRGCAHACRYCYARATHTYFGLGVGRDFEEIIFVKENLPDVLRAELRRSRWSGESIAIGTATDPYQPAEGRFRITRRCLEALAEAGNPCSITTKGTLIVRDIDLLTSLHRQARVSVHMSLITLDRDVWRRVEPGAPPPEQRLEVIERLSAAGIRVHVLMMPVLPGLTDGRESLTSLARAAADHGATGVTTAALRLAPGIRTWFLDFMRAEFPQLVRDYELSYTGSGNPPPQYARRLQERAEQAASLVRFPEPRERTETIRIGRQYLLPI